MTITDEQLSAYIDGELAKGDMDRIRGALDKDKALAVRLNQLKSPDRLIAAVYGEIDKASLPNSVVALLEPTHRSDNNISGSEQKIGWASSAGMKIVRAAQALPQWTLPLAASLVLTVGIGVGAMIFSDTRSPAQKTLLIASTIDHKTPVYQPLEHGPSGETVYLNTAKTISVTPVLTFKSMSGDYCREFILVENRLANRALACRDENKWAVRIVTAAIAQGGDNTYQPASAASEAAFENTIRESMSDDPLTLEEESALLQRNWGPQ